jgi:NAD(P)-dependent dehydrogenase (short-subunit alcohol dehydrogenase family)
MKPIAIIFGATGGIGQATRTALLEAGYRVIPVGRDLIDFELPTAEQQIREFLGYADPDVVINCAGVFTNNINSSYQQMFDVNLGGNWHIIKYYMDNPTPKPVKLVFVGSSAYKSGKKDYMLYSASKAALHNLWESAKEFFGDREITVNIVHPVRTRTPMVAPYRSDLDYLDPTVVAQMIVQLAQTATSSCSELSFEEHL